MTILTWLLENYWWLCVLILILLFVIWALCKTASDADDELEEMANLRAPHVPRNE